MMRALSPLELEAVETSVDGVRDRLGSADLDDLRQDLMLRLLEREMKPAWLVSWLQTCAKNWVTDQQRRLEKAWSKPKPYRRAKEFWEPSWYAPRDDAEEFAPFACKGARVMDCHETPTATNRVQEAMDGWLDSIGVFKNRHGKRK